MTVYLTPGGEVPAWLWKGSITDTIDHMWEGGASFILKTSKGLRKRILRKIKSNYHIDRESIINMVAIAMMEDPVNWTLKYCQYMLDNIDLPDDDNGTMVSDLVHTVSSLIAVDAIRGALDGETNRLIRPNISNRRTAP